MTTSTAPRSSCSSVLRATCSWFRYAVLPFAATSRPCLALFRYRAACTSMIALTGALTLTNSVISNS